VTHKPRAPKWWKWGFGSYLVLLLFLGGILSIVLFASSMTTLAKAILGFAFLALCLGAQYLIVQSGIQNRPPSRRTTLAVKGLFMVWFGAILSLCLIGLFNHTNLVPVDENDRLLLALLVGFSLGIPVEEIVWKHTSFKDHLIIPA
jgi:hypothetical protein